MTEKMHYHVEITSRNEQSIHLHTRGITLVQAQSAMKEFSRILSSLFVDVSGVALGTCGHFVEQEEMSQKEQELTEENAKLKQQLRNVIKIVPKDKKA